MAHYAKVVEGIVDNVIVVPDFETDGVEDTDAQEAHLATLFPGETWIKCSYNTVDNEHTNSGTPLRGQMASKGYTYDSENDVFYAPKPFDSWVLNTSIWAWEPPVAYPSTTDNTGTNNSDPLYDWDEDTTSWVEIDKTYPDVVPDSLEGNSYTP